MQPTDVYRLTGTGDPQVAPDGRIAYVVWSADEASNDYLTSIWLREGREARCLTDRTKKSNSARWSPDGTQLAFASNRTGEQMQLFVMPMDGGEPRQITQLDTDVADITWSPDGSRIAFTARDANEADDDERKREPRRITRLWYKLDDEGWLVERTKHVYVVDADGETPPRQVTKGEWNDGAPSWSPDGRRIAFVSMRHDDWDIVPAQDVYIVGVDGGEAQRLTPTDGWCESPRWSPDGSRIACYFTPGILDDPRHAQVAIVDVDTGERRIPTTPLDLNCLPFPPIGPPQWDGDYVYFCAEDHGDTHLYRTTATDVERVVSGARWVTGFDVRDGRVAYTASDATTLSELYVDDERVTDVTTEFTSDTEILAPERFTATSADGHPVDAWVLKPHDFDPAKTYPVLLNIHGGPFTQYGNRFFDEFQVYARAGYVVLFSNPRGSSGLSEAEGRAIRGPIADGPGWGTVDYDDLMAVVDTALRDFPYCDAERLGVMGGSYGGFMTTWIAGHSDRFKAACSERAVNNWHSMHGSSDLGWIFTGYFGAPAWEATDAWLKHSPITYAPNITTPMLILHSENDLRCPIEQAEQLFAVLRLLKREVEFVRFPAEGHELSRSGSPRHRVRRFEILLEWFDRKLK